MSSLRSSKGLILTSGSPLWSAYLRLRGVAAGKSLKIIGRPGIRIAHGSLIRLGNEVTLCSSAMANPLSEGRRCRLATLSKDARLIVGDRVGMSSALICCADRIEIGEGTLIGGGAMILDTDFHPRATDGTWLTDPAAVAKPVKIGKNCFIGARAIILKGVTIGDGAVIGAGAVVTKDIPAGTVAAGNPARVVTHSPDSGNP